MAIQAATETLTLAVGFSVEGGTQEVGWEPVDWVRIYL
jgi:hypothetical protein